MPLKIIDTSHWKADVPVNSLAIDGLYTKATEGNYYIDDSCDPLVQQAIAGGKKWGVYHFATNRVTDAVTEANFFVDNCLGYVGKGLLILDNENYHWSDGTWANDPYNVAWCKQWLDHVYSRTGVKPLIYMSASIITGADWSSVVAGGYGLICAAYVDNYNVVSNFGMDPNRDPNPRWDGVVNDVMWQFTSTGRLDGYGGNLDCNFFYGDAAAWDAYARVLNSNPTPPQPTPTPTPTPDPTPAPTPVVTTETVTETKDVPYDKITIEDTTKDTSYSEITQEGVPGVETITYTVTKTDGVETKREVVSDIVTTQPINQVTTIGTLAPVTPTPTNPANTLKQTIIAVIAAIAAAIAAFISFLHS